MPKTLRQHLDYLPKAEIRATQHDLKVMLTAPFVEDSQRVLPGGVFIARKGAMSDGHTYIPDAIERGAVAIIGERPPDELPMPLQTPYVQVRNAQTIIGVLAASYYDFPSSKMTVIGVTGTDGKTTTVHLVHSVLQQAFKTGFVSTIAADLGEHSADTGLHVTTPGAPQLQQYLAQMMEAGVTHVVLEMTSHGLAQGRLHGVNIDIAVLTNLKHEHLDFHGSWENYREAKAHMFRMLGLSQRKANLPKTSVLNRDDESFDYFAAIPADTVISYGMHDSAQIRATDVQFMPDATRFNVGDAAFALQLVGAFNISNALAAIGVGRALKMPDAQIRTGLQAVTGISGRMERIDAGQDFMALVDFAHTPNALQRALEAGRTMLGDDKKLIVVFGSAGLRDVEKRRLMAEIAAQHADMTVLTAEDPRTESLDEILEMMAQGCIAQGGVEGETFIRVRDRGAALYKACQMAQAGDLVMACGKGHEQSMCFGTIEYAWDDREALRAALQGAPLRTLPTAQT